MAISQFSMSAEPLQKIMPDFITIFHDTYWGDACLENRIQHKLQKTWIVLWNHVRMSQALFLLDHSGLSITDIAFQCGFASTSYFIARFKEKMGVTPREYKLR
mgnify:CR=1 FL=1